MSIESYIFNVCNYVMQVTVNIYTYSHSVHVEQPETRSRFQHPFPTTDLIKIMYYFSSRQIVVITTCYGIVLRHCLSWMGNMRRISALEMVFRLSHSHAMLQLEKNGSVLTLPMLRLLSSKAQEHKFFWKPSKPCRVGIHGKALTEYFHMSTHLPGFRSFFRFLSIILYWPN